MGSKKYVEGRNKEWFIYKDGKEKEDELVFRTSTFDQKAIQKKFNEAALQLLDGEEITFGTACDKWCFAPILTVVNKDGKLKKVVVKGEKVYHKPFEIQLSE